MCGSTCFKWIQAPNLPLESPLCNSYTIWFSSEFGKILLYNVDFVTALLINKVLNVLKHQEGFIYVSWLCNILLSLWKAFKTKKTESLLLSVFGEDKKCHVRSSKETIIASNQNSQYTPTNPMNKLTLQAINLNLREYYSNTVSFTFIMVSNHFTLNSR